jgi:RNA polymerase sigma-70 factor (ECF subfamily)
VFAIPGGTQQGPLVVADATPAPERTDPLASLARCAADGDRAAMRRVLETLGPTLLRVARGVLGAGHPELEDAVQDSMIGVATSLRAFRGECDLVHYASRIAVRACVALRRRARARGARLEPLEVVESRAPSEARSPSEQAASARRCALLRSLLDDLPDAQAEALAMRVVLGCSMEETASAAGAPLNTIRSRMRLAKEALRSRIEADPVLADALEVDP